MLLLQLLHSGPVILVCIFKNMSNLEECIVTRGSSYWEEWIILWYCCLYVITYIQPWLFLVLEGLSYFSPLPAWVVPQAVWLLGTFQNPLVRSFTKAPLHIFQINVVSELRPRSLCSTCIWELNLLHSPHFRKRSVMLSSCRGQTWDTEESSDTGLTAPFIFIIGLVVYTWKTLELARTSHL